MGDMSQRDTHSVMVYPNHLVWTYSPSTALLIILAGKEALKGSLMDSWSHLMFLLEHHSFVETPSFLSALVEIPAHSDSKSTIPCQEFMQVMKEEHLTINGLLHQSIVEYHQI